MTTTSPRLEVLGRAVAHDLQQPLFALDGLLELLEETIADGGPEGTRGHEQRELVRRARLALDTLAASVDDLREGVLTRLPAVERWHSDQRSPAAEDDPDGTARTPAGRATAS